MEQLPLGEGQMNVSGRRPRTPNSRRNIPVPVLVIGSIALALLLFSVVVLVKMGSPAATSQVEAELTL